MRREPLVETNTSTRLNALDDNLSTLLTGWIVGRDSCNIM
jgi:hypothetical protein